MTDTRIGESAGDIIAGVVADLRAWERFNDGTPDCFIVAGVTDEVFWEYCKSVDRDPDRIRDGLLDGTARAWILARYESNLELWARCVNGNPYNPRFADSLRSTLVAFTTVFPAEAAASVAELGLDVDAILQPD